MPNTAVTQRILDDTIKPIIERLSVLEKNDVTLSTQFSALGNQVAEFKGNMDASLSSIEKRMSEMGERTDKHAIKLEGLFVKYSEELKDIVEKGQEESKEEIRKINDVFDIGGHSDNAFNMKVFMRALKEEREISARNRLETKNQLRRESLKLLGKILYSIILFGGGIIGTLFAVGG